MAWLDFFTGSDTEADQAAMDRADAWNAARNKQLHDEGKMSDANYEIAVQHINEGHIDVEAEVNGAFKEGLDEGYDNVTGAIKTTLAAPFKFAFASIPWHFYLVGGLVLFWYMGGAVFIKGIFKKGR